MPNSFLIFKSLSLIPFEQSAIPLGFSQAKKPVKPAPLLFLIVHLWLKQTLIGGDHDHWLQILSKCLNNENINFQLLEIQKHILGYLWELLNVSALCSGLFSHLYYCSYTPDLSIYFVIYFRSFPVMRFFFFFKFFISCRHQSFSVNRNPLLKQERKITGKHNRAEFLSRSGSAGKMRYSPKNQSAWSNSPVGGMSRFVVFMFIAQQIEIRYICPIQQKLFLVRTQKQLHDHMPSLFWSLGNFYEVKTHFQSLYLQIDFNQVLEVICQ